MLVQASMNVYGIQYRIQSCGAEHSTRRLQIFLRREALGECAE
jgi:hypothetical protein